MPNPALLCAMADALMLSRPSHRYCQAHGIAWSATCEATGGLYLVPIRASGQRTFEIDAGGAEAALVEARDDSGETVDLVAWPVDRPGHVLTLMGRAHVLGAPAASDPATFFDNRPLRLFRRPLEWLQSACEGAAVLDAKRAAHWLIDVPGRLAPENTRHAGEIRAAMLSLVDPRRIVLPVSKKAA